MKKIHFLGIGGVGMSALARWSMSNGYLISGYDREPSLVTKNLIKDGAKIYFESSYIDGVESNDFTDLVVYSSAFKDDHPILSFFINKNFDIKKRSSFLAEISEKYDVIAIAGTHGKTTISCILCHIFKESGIDCSAFIGGFSKNYNSNILIGESKFMIIEADEYDRSFLSLKPYLGLISALDKDHSDTYLTYNEMLSAYIAFSEKCQNIIVNNKIPGEIEFFKNSSMTSYSISNNHEEGYSIALFKKSEEESIYNIYNGNNFLFNINLFNIAKHNVENYLAAICVSLELGIKSQDIISAIKSFKGIERRFEYHVNNENLTLIEDYAHHPVELSALIYSVRDLHPSKKITLIFQPHLFSRTKDFLNEFAEILSKVDRLVLLDIYAAREQPISGFSINNLFSIIELKDKIILDKKEISNYLSDLGCELILIVGAGDVNSIIPDLKSSFS